ncbi:hypothetical protein V8J36_12570 [Frigidibacter sp. MR17.14]|uniref:hypothetical protein n=1 Tax=Frigidibacter sp. MR17.14 TaxID=3126509 RepID=UPI003012B5E8
MQRTALAFGLAGLLGLAACGQNDMERGAVGATIAGLGAVATGNNLATVGAAAAVGAAAGALCDDAGVCH